MKSTPRKLSFAKKAVRVEARLNADQKKRIEHAANLKGTSLSDFIIGSADQPRRFFYLMKTIARFFQ